MNEDTFIVDDSDLRKYRMEIPNIIDDLGLSLAEYRLYGRIKRVAGAGVNGRCRQGIRTMAQRIGISIPTLLKAKNGLVERGLITITPGVADDQPDEIRIKDIWPQNFYAYHPSRSAIPFDQRIAEAAAAIQGDQFFLPGVINEIDQGDQNSLPGVINEIDQKNEPSKKEPIRKNYIASAYARCADAPDAIASGASAQQGGETFSGQHSRPTGQPTVPVHVEQGILLIEPEGGMSDKTGGHARTKQTPNVDVSGRMCEDQKHIQRVGAIPPPRTGIDTLERPGRNGAGQHTGNGAIVNVGAAGQRSGVSRKAITTQILEAYTTAVTNRGWRSNKAQAADALAALKELGCQPEQVEHVIAWATDGQETRRAYHLRQLPDDYRSWLAHQAQTQARQTPPTFSEAAGSTDETQRDVLVLFPGYYDE